MAMGSLNLLLPVGFSQWESCQELEECEFDVFIFLAPTLEYHPGDAVAQSKAAALLTWPSLQDCPRFQ